MTEIAVNPDDVSVSPQMYAAYTSLTREQRAGVAAGDKAAETALMSAYARFENQLPNRATRRAFAKKKRNKR